MTDRGPFWGAALAAHHDRPALIDRQGVVVDYRALDARVDAFVRDTFGNAPRSFGFLYLDNDVGSVVALLACLRAGHVPLLLPRSMPRAARESLEQHYRPDWIIESAATADADVAATLRWCTDVATPTPLAPELGLLLSTSGTTASPKLVRLSSASLHANARAIAEYLALDTSERALTVLPPSYSYGLSVITSHLCAGASVVVRPMNVLSREFVSVIDECGVTSISGVPYTYQMLDRTGFGRHALPSLRTLTQAGGRLDDRLARTFAELASNRRWRFVVMYGQTEATARIAYVPPERLSEKIGSIGVAIPGGRLDIDAASGELVYHGPNVSLGYATERAHLLLGDERGGTLRTGDLARRDDDGFHYLTGRLSRFVKVAGNRIGLDDVEQQLQSALACPVAVGGRDDRLVVFVESADEGVAQRALTTIADAYRVHHSLCRVRVVASLPLLTSGKKDYAPLLAEAAA